MKIIPKSIKGKLKSMRGPILEQMAIEQKLQADLRTTMITSKDDNEIDEARKCFNESVKHWEVLKDSLKEYDNLAKNNWKVSPDTLLVVAGNLLGIVLILTYEKTNIVVSKALNFVLRGRV